jgi:hypothetical protein
MQASHCNYAAGLMQLDDNLQHHMKKLSNVNLVCNTLKVNFETF